MPCGDEEEEDEGKVTLEKVAIEELVRRWMKRQLVSDEEEKEMFERERDVRRGELTWTMGEREEDEDEEEEEEEVMLEKLHEWKLTISLV